MSASPDEHEPKTPRMELRRRKALRTSDVARWREHLRTTYGVDIDVLDGAPAGARLDGNALVRNAAAIEFLRESVGTE